MLTHVLEPFVDTLSASPPAQQGKHRGVVITLSDLFTRSKRSSHEVCETTAKNINILIVGDNIEQDF